MIILGTEKYVYFHCRRALPDQKYFLGKLSNTDFTISSWIESVIESTSNISEPDLPSENPEENYPQEKIVVEEGKEEGRKEGREEEEKKIIKKERKDKSEKNINISKKDIPINQYQGVTNFSFADSLNIINQPNKVEKLKNIDDIRKKSYSSRSRYKK
jgi:hypothetical protein